MLRQLASSALILCALAVTGDRVLAEAAEDGSASGRPGLADLIAAYPAALERIEGNELVWRDGTRMPIDDGRGSKPFDDWLASPDIKDMMALRYPAGQPALAPARDFDPGRARNKAFFDKLYGDCQRGGVEKHLVTVIWLPRKYAKPLRFNSRQGAAERLAAVSARLDVLPAAFDVFLVPPAGTYNCRSIAGTDRVSAHGHGIAIDIALRYAHYWRWNGQDGALYRNKIPIEIVAAFEAEGFIWGGRWSHFDTMHFEYRPEFFPRRSP